MNVTGCVLCNLERPHPGKYSPTCSFGASGTFLQEAIELKAKQRQPALDLVYTIQIFFFLKKNIRALNQIRCQHTAALLPERISDQRTDALRKRLSLHFGHLITSENNQMKHFLSATHLFARSLPAREVCRSRTLRSENADVYTAEISGSDDDIPANNPECLEPFRGQDGLIRAQTGYKLT